MEGNPCAAQTVATGIVSFDDNIDRTTSEEVVPVALAGVVPVDVNDANGAISIGDEIVASSTVGVGMRADPSDDAYTQSAVIGKAMEPLEGERRTINVLVN